MKKKKFSLGSFLISLVFLIGIGLLLYPTLANWWNVHLATGATASYREAAENLSEEDYSQLLEEAHAYNEELINDSDRYTMTDEKRKIYDQLLTVNDSKIMGSISIPEINLELPVYHGTSESVLAVGAGHVEGSSLPVGGKGTHTVISGHRGLPSARLFTDLDKLEAGDYVILRVLNETLTYRIDEINVVLPEEVDQLAIDPDKDKLTLVTCTPYGINTHRLLLTGNRTSNLANPVNPNQEAHQINEHLIGLIIAGVIILVLIVIITYRDYKRRKQKRLMKEELDKENSDTHTGKAP